MTLDEFIEKIFKRYVCASDVDEKKEEYASTLFDLSGKVDFDKLLDAVSKNNDKDFVPPANNVLEWSRSCYKTEYKKRGSNGWIQVKIYNPIYKCEQSTDCFPAGTSEQAILNTYKKMFGGEGWRIVEVF